MATAEQAKALKPGTRFESVGDGGIFVVVALCNNIVVAPYLAFADCIPAIELAELVEDNYDVESTNLFYPEEMELIAPSYQHKTFNYTEKMKAAISCLVESFPEYYGQDHDIIIRRITQRLIEVEE